MRNSLGDPFAPSLPGWHARRSVWVSVVVLLLAVAAVEGYAAPTGQSYGAVSGYVLDVGDDDGEDGRTVVYVPAGRPAAREDDDVMQRAELTARVPSYARNLFRRKRLERSLAAVRKNGMEKRPLNAGEIMQILRRVALNRGSMQRGRLKGMRFGVSRKRSQDNNYLEALLGSDHRDEGADGAVEADDAHLVDLLETALQESGEDEERLLAQFESQDGK